MDKISPEIVTSSNYNGILVFASDLDSKPIDKKLLGIVDGLDEYESYPIPITTDIELIKQNVDKFIKAATEDYEETYTVVSNGFKDLGFEDKDIAPLFAKALRIDNIYLPESFVKIIMANSREKNVNILTPWPVKDYSLYSLFIDLMLGIKGETIDEKIKELDSNRYSYMYEPISTYHSELTEYLNKHEKDILDGNNTEDILNQIAEYLMIWDSDPCYEAVGRYYVGLVYNAAYLMYSLCDYVSTDENETYSAEYNFDIHSSIGLYILGSLQGDYDCAYYKGWDRVSLSHEFVDFYEPLKTRKDNLSVNGVFDADKFMDFMCIPHVWEDGIDDDIIINKIPSFMVSDILSVAERHGIYKWVYPYYIPVHNFNLPVYTNWVRDHGIKFPSDFIKKRFISNMLSRPDETV